MRIALVMAGGNVHGRILASSLKPVAPTVIDETGTARADALSRWLAPEHPAPMPDALAVPRFDGPEAREVVSACDYAINGGCGYVTPDYLKLPKRGWLNVHPGLLPEYRGADPVCWALRNGDPVGATVHLMEEEIDTGPILLRREMPWRGARTVKEARLQVIEFGAALLLEYLLCSDVYPPRPQVLAAGARYGRYCGGDFDQAETRLAGVLAARNAALGPAASLPRRTG